MDRIPGAFINARYSTDNQNPDSIEVQVEKCTEWCHRNNIPILGIFSDEATSGMKDSRPQYENMMMQLRQGIADTVVIYDQSRMFRKMTAWFAFRDELSALGVKVVSVTQPMIGKDLRDPTNFLTEGSMALFNQIWALQSRQKTVEKMRFMARNGQHTGGKPALGYMVENGRLVVCEAEAAIVRRIFQEYAGGYSYRQIIEGLNRDCLKTKRGSAFGANSLHDLLRNEKYIGVLTYGASPYREDGSRNTHKKDGANVIRIEDAIPPIVSKELFQKVQEKMAANKRQQGGRPAQKRDYPLKGKVFCAECKSAMIISTSKMKYDYYKCSGKKRKHTCISSPISANELESVVVDSVRQVLTPPENRKNLIRILQEERARIHAGAATTLQAIIVERRDVEKKLENATDAILAGLSSPTLLSKVRELENKKTALDAQAKSLKSSVDGSMIPDELLGGIIDHIVSSNEDASALLSIVSRVEVGINEITIWTIFDTDPSGEIDYTATGVSISPLIYPLAATGTDSPVTNTVGTASGVPYVHANFDRVGVDFFYYYTGIYPKYG